MSTQTIDDADVDYLTERCEIRRDRILSDEQAPQETQEMQAVAESPNAEAQYQTAATLILIGALIAMCVFGDIHSKFAALFV